MEESNWYAARRFNTSAVTEKYIRNSGIEIFRTPQLRNFIFFHCDRKTIEMLAFDLYGKLFVYHDPGERMPKAIPLAQMQSFILVTSCPGKVIPIPNPTPGFTCGQRVRVTGGMFKGAEGVIRRYKGNKRLIVSISGVVAVATCYIHPSNLEVVE
ncbi:MAG: hypothetical protein MJY62_03500 [Bacteroidales bacterium]|nr:hypothetical protein [Bacteroidales bacterium]